MEILVFDSKLKEKNGSYLYKEIIKLKEEISLSEILKMVEKKVGYEIGDDRLKSSLILVSGKIVDKMETRVRDTDQVEIFIKREI